MVKLSAEKSPVRSAVVGTVKCLNRRTLLLRGFIIAKEEELLVQDGSADRAAFLIAMKVGDWFGVPLPTGFAC